MFRNVGSSSMGTSFTHQLFISRFPGELAFLTDVGKKKNKTDL